MGRAISVLREILMRVRTVVWASVLMGVWVPAMALPANPTLPPFDPIEATQSLSLKEPYRSLTSKNLNSAAESTAVARYAMVTAARIADSLRVGAYLLDYLDSRPSLRSGRRPSSEDCLASERVIAIALREPGVDSLFLARAYFTRAEMFASSRDFPPADSVHRLCLGIRDRHLPANHPQLAFSCGALTTVNVNMGRQIALVYGKRAVKLSEGRFGPDHFRTAIERYGFAVALNQFGQVARASEECLRAVPVIRKQLGDDHVEVPRFVNALAILAKQNGDYLEARRQQELEWSLIQRRSPMDSTSYVRYLSIASEIRIDLGDYENGLRMAETALAYRLALNPPGDPRVANAKIQLARARIGMGDERGGAALYDSVMADLGRHGGGAPTEYSILMDAQRVRARRDVASARAWTAREQARADSATVFKDAYSAEASRFYMEALIDAGLVNEGLPTFERILRATTEVYGATHQSAVRMRETFARALLAARDARGPAEAREVARQRRADLRSLARGFSEQEALFVARRDGLALDGVLIAALRKGATPADRAGAFAALASSRGLVLEEMARRLREGRASVTPAVVAVLDSLRAARRELSRAMLRPETQPGLAPDAGLAVARSRLARWERALSDQVGTSSSDDELEASSLAQRLAPGEALVSYLHYSTLGAGASSMRRLAAVVLHRDGRTEVHDLVDAAVLEQRVHAWREQVAPRGSSHESLGAATRSARVLGDSLRQAIWDPLARSLAGASRVLVVPDGALQLVDLAALPSKGDGWVIDSEPLIVRLSSERDLLGSASPADGKLVVAVGDPDFDGAGGAVAAAAYRGAPSTCRNFAEVRFAALPGARAEANEVAQHWRSAGTDSVMLLEGGEADEARIKLLAPRLGALHVATHGFFMGEGCGASSETNRGVGRLTTPSKPVPAAPTAAFFSHRPDETLAREQTLRLSGLAFAGANHRAQASVGQEDGVLTAEEIATLDLSHAREVVLSACDTGVGDLSVGEGVFGVQRAFQLAGARHLVMSLWSVDDTSARAWMQAYYAARLESGQPPAEAARTAARTRLSALRHSGAPQHPGSWAGFLATGR